MKRIIFIVIVSIFFLNLTSCEAEDQEYSYSIKDALKISAWVFDESVEGNVYQEDDAVYPLKQLNLNEVGLMAPLGYMETKNKLNIFFEFNGIIEVVAKDEDIQLSTNNRLTPYYVDESQLLGRTYGYSAKFVTQGFVSGTLLASDWAKMEVKNGAVVETGETGVAGTEYYLNVNAYNFDNEETPIIQAQLKLVVLKAPPPFLEDSNGSPWFSIELVSYEYSDMAKMMDEIVDEDYE